MFSVEQVEYMQAELSSSNLQIIFCPDPMQEIWTNRPPMPESPAFVYDIEYAGKSCTEKIASIRTELKKKGAESVMLSALDEIAWTLNLRGNDVHCNPVVISYLLITEDSTILFIAPEKVTEEVRNYLKRAESRDTELRRNRNLLIRSQEHQHPDESGKNQLCYFFLRKPQMPDHTRRSTGSLTESCP